MSKFTSPLDNVKVASPCSANWEEMYGDARKRFCSDCKLNVYNLSGMTRSEAETLLLRAEGRLCVRFYRRADGSVITQDCPVGWAKVKQRAQLWTTAVASLLMALFTGVLFVSVLSKQRTVVGRLIPFASPTPRYEPLMGAIALPPKNTNTNKPSQGVMGNIAVPKDREKFEMGKVKVLSGERRDG